jgi:RNA polymerase sigma-70 factor, ECF subfamily
VGTFALNEPAAALEDDLVRARRGDLAAFGQLIATHEGAVYSLALRMLRAPDLAEDMAQEVFLKLHASLPSIESLEHLKFWLRRVTTHRAIDSLRRSAQLPLSSLDDEVERAGAEDNGDPLLQTRLRELLGQLNPAARAVMTLRYQEDLDPKEIARTLDMSINTVKSHLKRSLEILRQELREPRR